MNKYNKAGLQLINGFHFVTVDSIKAPFAFAKCNGQFVRFVYETGYNIITGHSQFPEFGSNGPAQVPVVGESLVMFVVEVKGGWIATAWGRYTEFKAAQKVISDRLALPKAAPKTAPVAVAAANEAVRKLTFTPRRFPRVNTAPVAKPAAVQLRTGDAISLETAIEGGYDLGSKGTVGAECTIAPAPKAAEPVRTGK